MLQPAFVTNLTGKARPHYRYRDVGSAAYICRGHALLQAGPIKLAGFFGWLGWGLIHIAFLAGLENRISTVATWLATIARAPPHGPNVHPTVARLHPSTPTPG